jgi:hypothetical protein
MGERFLAQIVQKFNPEIITFDELLERAKFIIESAELVS